MVPKHITYSLFSLLLLFCFSLTSRAVSLVNNSGQDVLVSNGLTAPYQDESLVANGASYDVPNTWGDAQHSYLYLRTAAGSTDVGSNLKNRYGTIKIPTFINYEVNSSLALVEYTGEISTSTPAPPPVDNTPPAEEEPPVVESPVSQDPSPDAPVIPKPMTTVRGKGNGTWLYDAQFSDGPAGPAYTRAGLWVDDIVEYNKGAGEEHKLNQLFTYGGNLEMYAPDGEANTSRNMLVIYFPPSFYNENLSIKQLGDSGYHSTQAYKLSSDLAYADTNTNVEIIPILDGRVDAEYLARFNTMTTSEAQLYADNVARVFCADNAIGGIQVDLEPFDINQPGQYDFYRQLAKNFAGQNNELDFGAVNQLHPEGRSFSIFTFPNRINQSIADILNEYDNGYVIYSLYDLGSNGLNTPSTYYQLVLNELEQAMAKSDAHDVYYQLAIPGAASVHEYESYNGASTGYSQLEYVQAAMDAINNSGVRDDPFFMGVAVWGWSTYMSYPPHSNNTFSPAQPPQDVLDYLKNNL